MTAPVAINSPLSLRAQAPADWRLSKETDWPEFAKRFDEVGSSGALVVLDALRGGKLVANPERAQIGFIPGSTFKIPNTMLALHLGAVKGLEETFKWNGERFLVEGEPFLPAACNADIALRDAFRNSCIPVYQELSRRIGSEAYKDWLVKLDYGNAEIGGAPLDQFWLKGDLRISADQQTKFLRKLVIKTLPLTPRSLSLTEEAMFIEKIGETAIHGKTGYVFDAKPATGWWVGFAQRGEDVVLIALNLDITKPEHAKARYDLVKEALTRIKMI